MTTPFRCGLPEKKAAQGDHEDQDQLAGAGRAQGPGFRGGLFRFTRRSHHRPSARPCARPLPTALPGGEVKQALFELVNAELASPRERYEALISDPARVERELQQGAEARSKI